MSSSSSSTTGVNFSVNWPALKDVGVDGKMPIGLQLTDVPAATALQLVLKQAISSDADNPVALGVVDGTVTISTRQDLKQRKAVAFQLPEAYIADANSRTARKLAVPIPVVNLDGNKLCNVIEFLRNTTGANFFCNWSAIQAAGADPYVAITLQRTNVPADQVLTLVLQQARTSDAKNPITYGIVDGVIIISTLQDLQAMPDREKIRTAQERGTAAPASQPAAGGP